MAGINLRFPFFSVLNKFSLQPPAPAIAGSGEAIPALFGGALLAGEAVADAGDFIGMRLRFFRGGFRLSGGSQSLDALFLDAPQPHIIEQLLLKTVLLIQRFFLVFFSLVEVLEKIHGGGPTAALRKRYRRLYGVTNSAATLWTGDLFSRSWERVSHPRRGRWA